MLIRKIKYQLLFFFIWSHFSATKWPPGRNLNFPNLITHFLDTPKHIQRYDLSILQNVGGIRGSRTFCEKVFVFFTNFLTPMTTEDFVKPFYKTKWHSIESSSKSSVCLFIRCKSSLKKKNNVRDGRTIGQNRVTTIYPQFSTISNVYFQFQSKKFDISRHN